MPQSLLSVVESVQLAAPAADVWKRIGRFDDMSWHPAIASVDMVDGSPTEAGARRLATIAEGGQIHETLLDRNEAERSYRYRIDSSPLPLIDYDSTISVRASDKGGCMVTWRASFHGIEAEGLDDDAVCAIMAGVYRTGLDALAAPGG